MIRHLSEQTEKRKKIRNCNTHNSHGQVNRNCSAVKRGTCRKTGLWDGSLGSCLFSKTKEETGPGNKTRNRPRRPNPTGGPDNGTKHQDHRPADTRAAQASDNTQSDNSPDDQELLLPVSWVRHERQLLPGQRTCSTSAPRCLSAACHQPKSADLCVRRWQ